MKKLFKSKTFLGAVMSIALCISLIAGATFAIFTSEAKVNIAVSSGKVQVTATVEDFKLYSLENIDMTTLTGTEIDRTEEKTFINGGTATLEGNALTLDRLTPGDKVTFTINIVNNSNVSIKYRTLLSVADEGLFEALKISVGNRTSETESGWTTVTEAGVLSSEECVIELPASATDEYQDKSCNIVFIVEAVQGNVDTSLNSEKIIANLKGGKDVVIEEDAQLDGEIGEDGNVDPDAEMKLENAGNVKLTLNGTLTSRNISGGTWGCMRIMPGTQLTVSANENGKFINTKSNSMFNVAGGELVVNGGYFESASSCFWLYTTDDVALQNSKLVINGGMFNAKNGIVNYTSYNAGTIVINGGTFKSENNIVVSDKYEWSAGRYMSNGLKITVNGGKFYNWDPSDYVDENHEVVTSAEGSDTVYTVIVK